MTLSKYIPIVLWIGFVITVAAANWTLAKFGIVPIGFGMSAPSGVYFAGLAFTFRDLLHERGGRLWVVSAIISGALLSGILEDAQKLALASGIAFLVSEFTDWAIYNPLRRKGWVVAVASSNIGGLIVDSALFLWIAFGSLEFIEGQIVGKTYMTIGAIAVMWVVRRIIYLKSKRIGLK